MTRMATHGIDHVTIVMALIAKIDTYGIKDGLMYNGLLDTGAIYYMDGLATRNYDDVFMTHVGTKAQLQASLYVDIASHWRHVHQNDLSRRLSCYNSASSRFSNSMA
ncbi:hypothetical protein O0I10_011996 [Lichtheimia ornata]|uniref:Uncharacterized protein n=1 Tax=Lichtheimia ornata TaxID=688661 RepID=A0AAD7XTG3_9FUNG|nr:uncharacterized protein O0I10_011996 [Lichtheimia ornata]KAJ8652373.1 hypothetical protein O0I10_011996 [Lichtheimia ornata]